MRGINTSKESKIHNCALGHRMFFVPQKCQNIIGLQSQNIWCVQTNIRLLSPTLTSDYSLYFYLLYLYILIFNKHKATESHTDIWVNTFFLNSAMKTRLMGQIADFISLPKGSVAYPYRVCQLKANQEKMTTREFKWIASESVLRQHWNSVGLTDICVSCDILLT